MIGPADVVGEVFGRLPDFRRDLEVDPRAVGGLTDPYVVLDQLAIWANTAARDGDELRAEASARLIDDLAAAALEDRAMWDLVLLQLADGFPWDERIRARFAPATRRLFAEDAVGTARFPGGR